MSTAWDPFSAEWRRWSFIARKNAAKRLSRLLFQVLLPLPQCRKTVHPGAMREGALGGRDVLGLAAPGLLRSGLQGAAVREGELPRERSELVHGVEMGGRLLVGLPAREERDTGDRGRHAGLEQPHGLLGHLLDGGLLRRLLAGDH